MAQSTSAQDKAALYRQVFGIQAPTTFRELKADIFVDGQFERQGNVQWDSFNNQLRLPKTLLPLLQAHLIDGSKIDPLWLKGDQLDLTAMRKRGFDILFRKDLFRLDIKTPADIRRRLTISYFPTHIRDIDYSSEALSGYLNLFSSNRYDVSSEQRYAGSQLFEASVSWQTMTWQYEGEYQKGSDQPWFNRGGRMIIADEQRQARLIIGDQTPQNVDWSLTPPPLAGSFSESLVGLGVNRRISMADASVAQVSDFYYDFSLDSDSEVMVYINGKMSYQVKLQAGRYRLQDLPLEAGFNDIRIDTVGADGAYNRIEDSYYQRYDMLQIGQWEFDIAAGLPYREANNMAQLDDDNTLFLGYLRYGLSDKWTLGGYLQYQERLSVAGLVQQWGTSLGYLTLDVAASDDSFDGDGWASEFEWSSDALYTPIQSYVASFTGYGLLLSYFSERFNSRYRATDEEAEEQALYGSEIRATVSPYLSLGFSTNTQLSLQANYIDFHDQITESSISWQLRLEQRFGDINLWAEYRSFQQSDRQQYWSINFEWRPSDSPHYVQANYDSELDRNQLIYEYTDSDDSFTRYHIEENYTDSHNNDIKIYRDYHKGYDQSRYQLQQVHRDGIEVKQAQWTSGGARGYSYIDTSYTSADEANTIWYAETGVAFAGRHWGITRPIEDSFTVFYANPGFEGSVEFGDGARIDRFGAAVISDTSSYEINQYQVDAVEVASLAGLGQTAFEVKNRYASGTAIGIGSSANLFMRGVLVDQLGRPIPLKAGQLIPLDSAGQDVLFFTGQEGKITVKGVSVGRWRIELPGQLEAVTITIEDAESGIFEIGTIEIQME